MNSTTPKRRFMRYNLRAMLVVLTAFGVWLGVQVNRVKRQKEVVQWVEENGGKATYNWQFDENDRYSDKTKPPGPAWLQRQIGDEYFQSVVAVTLHQTEVHDPSPLARLTKLKWLHLSGNPVGDISALASLTHLKRIGLSNTRVIDLSPLANLTNLETLYLVGTQVNDISPLAKLPHLKTLDLAGSQVSDLSQLANVSSLEALHISNTPVTAEAIAELQKALPSCKIYQYH